MKLILSLVPNMILPNMILHAGAVMYVKVFEV